MPVIDPSWTLFLDRDGVINRRLPGNYVREWAEFQWLPGVLEAIEGFSQKFGRVFVVTNQQGIGKGVMAETDLAGIHRRMLREVSTAGGHIDAVYYCPDLSSRTPNCRKPAPDMALRAREEFSEVDFQRSVMVGDSLSDMQFGDSLGMYTVLISTKTDEAQALQLAKNQGLNIGAEFGSLYEFYADLLL